MAESAGVEARQRFCQCDTAQEMRNEMEKVLTSLKCVEIKLAAAQTGECKVKNNTSNDVTSLCEMANDLRATASSVADKYIQHLTMHPKQGRAAEDSGYSSQTHSTLMGIPELSQTDSRRRQSFGGCNGLPIQEEGNTDC